MNIKYKKLWDTIVNNSKAKIIDLADTELTNEAKKKKLDNFIINVIKRSMDIIGFNAFEKWIINTFIVPKVDDVTQYIYDLLKANVAGVTK